MSLTLALLLGALFLLPAASASAQLVSNTGQTAASGSWTLSRVQAQAFTTGSNADGYTLQSIGVVMRTTANASNTATDFGRMKAELWSDNSGDAGTKLADLTKPASFPGSSTPSTVTFTAPAGTTLAASTTYHVVFYASPASNSALRLHSTTSDDEDTGGAAGWSIANSGRQILGATSVSGTWTTRAPSLRIVVNGAAAASTTNANLSALTAATHTSAMGTFTALTLSPAFSATTTSYTAQVGNAQTHLKLTPTVAATGATVKVGKQGTTLATVTSGSASAAIPLTVGSNAITVEVTAADNTTTKTYTVTVTRLASGQVWAATYTPPTGRSCGTLTACSSALTDNSFVVGGQTYRFTNIIGGGASGLLIVTFDAGKNTALQALKLCVGSTAFDFPDDSDTGGTWTNSGLTWTVGTPVSLSIGTSCPQQVMTPTQSTDATLSGLTATSSMSASGTFSALSIGTFASGTTSYTATVANSMTHVKLTPTVNDSGATVTVQGTTVASGSASGAIALSVGSNALAVVVTAEDGTTTQTYTVTVTRAASSNANLSGLAASTSTSSGGSFTTLTLTPSFSASTTSYTATVPNARTHAKLTPTVADTGKATVTVQGVAVTSGSASGAITLSVGNNALAVVVTAEDGTTTRTYTVTVMRQAAQQTQSSNANLGGLTASSATSSGGSFSSLTLSPSFSAATTTYTATVPNARTHAKVTPTVAHASATVTVNGTTVTSGSASAAITLSEGSNAITVRVTAQDSTTTKDYTVTITRQATTTTPTVSLSVSPNPVTEGSAVMVTVSLSSALSSPVTIPITISTTSPNTAESGDVGTLTSITINSHQTTGTGTIMTTEDADEDDETFTVALGTTPSGVTAGSPNSVQVTIREAVDGTPCSGRQLGQLKRKFGDFRFGSGGNVVNEGRSVRVWATLRDALTPPCVLSIPITAREPGRYQGRRVSTAAELAEDIELPLAPIVILAGQKTGSSTIRTRRDDDSDDELFFVVLDEGALGGDVGGQHNDLGVQIRDGEYRYRPPTSRNPPANPPPDPDTGGGDTGGTDTGGGSPSGGGTPSGGGGGGGAPPPGGDSPSPEEPRDPEQTDDCGEDDRENLVRFYEAADGDNWLKNENWNSEEPLQQWYGVDTVDTDEEDGEEVVSLRLADNNLSGDMPTEELLCLNENTEIKELALWDNELSGKGKVPDELVRAVERAVLRDIAETIDLNPGWFDDYEDPFSFSDWHGGVTTDDDGRVTELDFTGEDITGVIPGSVFELERLTAIETGCEVTLEIEAPGGVSVMPADDCEEETPPEDMEEMEGEEEEPAASGGGGCALGRGDSSVSTFGLLLVTLLVFAALVRKRAQG